MPSRRHYQLLASHHFFAFPLMIYIFFLPTTSTSNIHTLSTSSSPSSVSSHHHHQHYHTIILSIFLATFVLASRTGLVWLRWEQSFRTFLFFAFDFSALVAAITKDRGLCVSILRSFLPLAYCYSFLSRSAIGFSCTVLLRGKSIVVNMLIRIKTWSSVARSSSVGSPCLTAASALYLSGHPSKQDGFISRVLNAKSNKTGIIFEHFPLSVCLRSAWAFLHTKSSPAWCLLVVHFCTVSPPLIHDIWGFFPSWFWLNLP